MEGTLTLENGPNAQQTVEKEHKPEQELVPTLPRLTVVQIVLEKLPKQDLVKNMTVQVELYIFAWCTLSSAITAQIIDP